jgi:LacI family transcriptional regulator
MAAGAMRVLAESGRSVPGDVAVIGFDDDTFAPTLSPPLSTVRQPATEFGAAMADVLMRLIAGETVPQRTIIPTELVQRRSA